jgi:hypothetical protein
MDYKSGRGCLKFYGLIILMPLIEFINVEWMYSTNKLREFIESYATLNYQNGIFFSHSNCINKHFDVYAFKKED